MLETGGSTTAVDLCSSFGPPPPRTQVLLPVLLLPLVIPVPTLAISLFSFEVRLLGPNSTVLAVLMFGTIFPTVVGSLLFRSCCRDW